MVVWFNQSDHGDKRLKKYLHMQGFVYSPFQSAEQTGQKTDDQRTSIVTTTSISIENGAAQDKQNIPSESVDLIVTSPPYPMIEMWDSIFSEQNPLIAQHLEAKRGRDAFALMHTVLDTIWKECDRVLKPGGIVCINIGDATRTIDGDFQLYSNHSRILQSFLDRGYSALPDILWRKPTNAPNKFMGSGMLPVGAYVTYEHEYILILRKGTRREFSTPEEKRLRRESAFFWEERNMWFSDIWNDIRGTAQTVIDTPTRERNAAFPLELAYRLICMFSVKHDVVLDPFVGTGTTLLAALAAERNGIGIEIDPVLAASSLRLLMAGTGVANAYMHARLLRHIAFAEQRSSENKPLKYVNKQYEFPVMTRQEQEILLKDVMDITVAGGNRLCITYNDQPQADIANQSAPVELKHNMADSTNGDTMKHLKQQSPLNIQEQLRF
jgi:modification methylase